MYHFELQGLEQTRMPKDFPYTAKSQALLSEPCVSVANFSCKYFNITKLS